MAEKRFTKEQERAYWQEKREAYIAMSRRMLEEPGYEWRDPLAFYRDIFPEGFLQERWDGDAKAEFDGKPNAIALKFGPKTRKQLVKGKKVDVPVIERYTVTDDLDGVSELVKASIAENAPVYMAPVSFFGKSNKAANARFLHAFAVDLDGMTPGKLGTVLKQMRNGHDPSLDKHVSMPQATYIVMSGRGCTCTTCSTAPFRSSPPSCPSCSSSSAGSPTWCGPTTPARTATRAGSTKASTRDSACPAPRPGSTATVSTRRT